MTLRRWEHPGKFAGGLVIDRLAYRLAQQGTDESKGSQGDEWAGLLAGGILATPDEVTEFSLTPDEVTYLETVAGLIAREDEDGHVVVTWYETEAELSAAWDGVQLA